MKTKSSGHSSKDCFLTMIGYWSDGGSDLACLREAHSHYFIMLAKTVLGLSNSFVLNERTPFLTRPATQWIGSPSVTSQSDSEPSIPITRHGKHHNARDSSVSLVRSQKLRSCSNTANCRVARDDGLMHPIVTELQELIVTRASRCVKMLRHLSGS